MKPETHYSVIVLGGGTAGTVAAIQAGRAGARTLLVEKNGMLGGTMTVAGVNFPALFFAWGKQIIAGIGWDLVRQTLAETGEPLPDMADPSAPTWRRHIPINVAIFAALADQAVLDAGVELLLHAMPARVRREGGSWQVEICTKSGLRDGLRPCPGRLHRRRQRGEPGGLPRRSNRTAPAGHADDALQRL